MLNAKYKFEMYEKRPRNARGAFSVRFIKSREAKVKEGARKRGQGRERMNERKKEKLQKAQKKESKNVNVN